MTLAQTLRAISGRDKTTWPSLPRCGRKIFAFSSGWKTAYAMCMPEEGTMHPTRLLRRVIHYIRECFRENGEMHILLTNHKEDELHVEESADDLREESTRSNELAWAGTHARDPCE